MNKRASVKNSDARLFMGLYKRNAPERCIYCVLLKWSGFAFRLISKWGFGDWFILIDDYYFGSALPET